jgi:crotonobetainyl-CoA:carnitine CoA-transferase CaiB-like acyl-CoA transferase
VSAYFAGANRNKRVQVLDLNRAEDFARFSQLIAGADVLLENFRPESARKWGLTPEFTQGLNPRLVHCRVSGFGDTGPLAGLPAYDTAVQALCGLMSVNGDAQSGPLRVGLPVVDMTTGLNAMIGVLLALQARAVTGRGQFVETTLFANAVAMLHPHASNFFATGDSPRRTGNAHPNIYPYDSFETRTGPIYLAIGNDRQFQAFCAHLGQPGWALDARFASNPQRSVHREALRALLAPALAGRDGMALADALVRQGVPCAPVCDVAQVLQSEQARAMGLVVNLGDGYQGVASPVALRDTPATYRIVPPTLPDHAPQARQTHEAAA